MNKTGVFIALLAALLMTGCGSSQKNKKPTGEYVWTHPVLESKVNEGQITDKEAQHKFNIIKNKCKIEALKIPIPSPSCYAVQRNCSGLTGFAAGFCRGSGPIKRCNYSSVNAAEKAQVEIYDSCMAIDGWQKVWQPY